MSSTVKNQEQEKNKQQILSILGLKYIRILVENIKLSEVRVLKKKYWYVFIYSYTKLDLPEFHLKTQTTSIIDLSQPLDDIFKKFKKNTRNEIRKTETISGLQFCVPDPNIKTSYTFYKSIKKKDDNTIPDIQEEFTGCLFFNAYLNNILIVSMSCYDNGSVLRLKHIVSRRKQKKYDGRLIGYASRKLIWEICKYGKQQRHQKFDLAGMNLTDPAKQGIVIFKQSFGGELSTLYTYRYQKKLFTLLKETLRLFRMNIN